MLDYRTNESTTGNAKRQRAYAGRQRESGRRRVAWWLDSWITVEINRRATARGGDKAGAINAVLRELLEPQKPAPKASAAARMTIPTMLSAAEAARRLAVTVPELGRWRNEGRGPKAHRVKDTWRYSEQDVHDYIQACRVAAEDFDK